MKHDHDKNPNIDKYQVTKEIIPIVDFHKKHVITPQKRDIEASYYNRMNIGQHHKEYTAFRGAQVASDQQRDWYIHDNSQSKLKYVHLLHTFI